MRILRHIIVFLLFLTLLVALGTIFWHYFSIKIVELWSNSENRSIVFGIFSSITATAICGLFIVLFRRTIGRWFNAFVLRGRSIDKERKRVEQERLYLDNLIERFRKEFPWEINKYTDLEFVQEDLEKQARRVQPHLWKLPDTKDEHVDGKVKSTVNLRHFLRTEKGPIMLKGDPGTGKTLTVRRFAVDQAEVAKKRLPNEVKLPVYVFLGFYIGKTVEGELEPVEEFLKRYLQEEFPAAAFLREHLTEYLVQGRLLLLFDGLNELLPDEYTSRSDKLEEFVLKKYPKNKAIFTCRTLRHTSLSGFNTVTISDLSNEQIKRFITAYRGESNAEILYRELLAGDGFMLRVCRNPFMLQMLVRRNPERELPQSPAQLFQEYVHDQLASYATDAEKTADILSEVAFSMQKGGKFAGVVTYEWLQDRLAGIPLDNHLRIAHRTQLVDYTSEKRFRFYHQILQEYFAAVALRNEWGRGKNLEVYFADYRWEETILACTGIVDDAKKFIHEIWSPDKNTPEAFCLATKALGSSGKKGKIEYYHDLLNEAKENLDQKSDVLLSVETIKALSYIDDVQTSELLGQTLVKHDGWIRELCIQTLGNSRNPAALLNLRSSVIALRSLPVLLSVAPYFNRRTWLWMLATLPASWMLRLLIPLLKVLFYLFLIPFSAFIIFPLLGNFFSSNKELSLIIVGSFSLLALIIFSLLYFKKQKFRVISRINSKTITESIPIISLMIFFIILLMIFTIYIFIPFMIIFFLILIIGIFLFIYCIPFIYILNCVIKFKSLPRFTYYLYEEGKWLLFGSFITILVVFVPVIISAVPHLFSLLDQLPPVRYIEQLSFIKSLIANNNQQGSISIPQAPGPFKFITNFLNFGLSIPTFFFKLIAPLFGYCFSFLYQPFILRIVLASVAIIWIASVTIHFMTLLANKRLQKYRNSLTQRDAAHQMIQRIILNPSAWPQVRVKAIKEIRLIEVPSPLIDDLEKLNESHDVIEKLPGFRRELERTVYELRMSARDRDREVLDRRYIETLINRSVTHLQERRFQEALVNLDRAITLDEENALALAYRGVVYCHMQQYPEALVNLNLAIALDEENALALASRGVVYRHMQQYPEALADLDQAIMLDGKNGWNYYCRSLIHLALNRTSAFENDLGIAIELAETDLENASKNPFIGFNLALYYLVHRDTDRSETQYEQSIKNCTSISMLETAIANLNDFLKLQPSNDLVQQISIQAKTRIIELQKTPDE